MHLVLSRGLVVVAVVAVWAGMATPAAAVTCTPIATPADFDLIRARPHGIFCLANDIDFAGAGNFRPVGTMLRPFSGSFSGGGHALRNLVINSGYGGVGLFGIIDGAKIRDLNLPGIVVRSVAEGALVGAVAGEAFGSPSIDNVYVSGLVRCLGSGCRVGGIVGQIDGGTVHHVRIAASVEGGGGGASGGIAGQSNARIHHSYATGPVRCGNNCSLGGLVGHLAEGGEIQFSFSSGPVVGGADGDAGGLIGTSYGIITGSYATSSVQTKGGSSLASPFIAYFSGAVRQSFAAGRLRAGTGSTTGGMAAAIAATPAGFVKSYWDRNTTRQITSLRGTPLTTLQSQAALPGGFQPPWDITAGYSYPFLNVDSMAYVSTLATLVQANNIYTFLPIEQREPSEYQTPPSFADQAALAAVYTTIARAIGITTGDNSIKATPIDQYFWNDGTQTASWTGPVTGYATLGSLTDLDIGTAIDDSNIIGPLKSKQLVVLRGHYDGQGGPATHWLLATLFTATGGVSTNVVANDPWTGTQVWIDLATHQVVRPAGFPLANFTVDGYQTVTLN